MFAVLDEFSNQEFYEEHPVMWFLTEQCAYRIDLISTFVTPSNSDSYNIFETEDELNAYVSEAVEKSTFITSTDTDDISQIMTLSTCAYVYDKARTVVIGKITAVEY